MYRIGVGESRRTELELNLYSSSKLILYCIGLEKSRGAELELNLLLDLQNLVFSDQEFYQTSIFFRDKNNKIDEIFRL